MKAAAEDLEEWLHQTYDAVDYDDLFSSAAPGLLDDSSPDVIDEGSEELIYGEMSVAFFLEVLDRALAAVDPGGRGCGGFVDLGGGKGQLALAAACAEPHRLCGACVSLELLPELHLIGAAATKVASVARAVAVCGSMYDVRTLDEACAMGDAAVVFAYATKFASLDGVHAERLSAALAASQLPPRAVVATVNKRLCACDGWREVAPPIEGDTPHEDAAPDEAARGTAYFWRRA